MRHYHSSDLTFPVLAAAPATLDWSRIAATLGEELDAVLHRLPVLPEGMVDTLVAEGDVARLRALLRNRALTELPSATVLRVVDRAVELGDSMTLSDAAQNLTLNRLPGVTARLAATGLPDVLRFSHQRWASTPVWSLADRRIGVAAAEDPLTYEPAESDATVVSRHPVVLRPTLTGPQPLTRAERLRAVLSMWRHGGTAEFHDVADWQLPPDQLALVTDLVSTGDDTALAAAVSTAEGMTGALDELRDTTVRMPGEGTPDARQIDWYRQHLALREPLDWDRIVAADTAEPFHRTAVAALASRPDCPAGFHDALFAREPVVVAGHTTRPDVHLLDLDCPARSRTKVTGLVLRRGLASGMSPGQAIEHATPALALLKIAAARDDDSAALRESVTELVAAGLGEDPAVWRGAVKLLKTCPGNLAELLKRATDAPVDRWPLKPKPAKGTGVISGHRAAVARLLSAAGDRVSAALVSDMDDQSLVDLIRLDGHRPGWWDVLATDPRRAALLAEHAELSAADIDRLLPFADPDTNGLLYTQPAATDEQRARIRRAEHGPRLTALLDHHENYRVTELSATRDFEQYRAVMNLHHIIGVTPQRRALLDAWDRFGGEGLRVLLSGKPVSYNSYHDTRRHVMALWSEPAGAGARERLRAEVVAAETPRAQIEAWRTRTDLAALAKETHRWHWDALVAEHHREPFGPDALWRLGHIDGAPAAFTTPVAGRLYDRHHRAYRRLNAGEPPEQVLAAHPPDDQDRTERIWTWAALDAGLITWDQLLCHAAPATSVLGVMSRMPARDARAGRAALTRLAATTLRDDTEAWALALRMLREFTGTVAEALSTAALAAGATS